MPKYPWIALACRCRPLPLLPAVIVIAALSTLAWAVLVCVALAVWAAL